jgi:hypothetical protein
MQANKHDTFIPTGGETLEKEFIEVFLLSNSCLEEIRLLRGAFRDDPINEVILDFMRNSNAIYAVIAISPTVADDIQSKQ